MNPITFPQVNAALGQPEGWDETENGPCETLPVLKHETGYLSAWKPSPEDLVMLLRGGCVYLHVHGAGHPPVWLEASIDPNGQQIDPPEDAVELIQLEGLGNSVVMDPEMVPKVSLIGRSTDVATS